MSEHAPIPPNCPYFTEWTQGTTLRLSWSFRVGFHGPGGVGGVDLPSEHLGHNKELLAEWRPIIAAVAEVYWRKEQEYRDRIFLDVVLGKGCSEGEKAGLWTKPKESRDNARAWRAWGEEGETP